METKEETIYILDTNVPLHDCNCLANFPNCRVIVPITVIEELDTFKKEDGDRGFNARRFSEFIVKKRGVELYNGGVEIGNNCFLSLHEEMNLHKELKGKLYWNSKNPDLRILNIAFWVREKNPDARVVIKTKDYNFILRAGVVGIEAEDYDPEKLISDSSALYKGYCRIPKLSRGILQKANEGVAVGEIKPRIEHLFENQYIISGQEEDDVLAFFSNGIIKRIKEQTVFGISPLNIWQSAALHALFREDVTIVTLTGKAGTGKTLLALAASLEQSNIFSEIILARPLVPLSDKDRVGFLPGNLTTKINPYMQPLFDNLAAIEDINQKDKNRTAIIKELKNKKRLTIEALDHIRGRTLVKKYVIVDEAQNLTPKEVKAVITRAGEGTKVILTGDIEQVDHLYLNSETNGLTHLIEKFKGQSLFAHINLEKGERSPTAELAARLL